MGSGTAAKRTLTRVEEPGERPPSVDALARSIADSGLPHPILVDIARAAIADRDPGSARARADEFRRTLLAPVVNATGVLLHTNLGRAPLAVDHPARPQTIEFDLATGERGSRQRAVGQLFAKLCGAEDAIVVNNNAAAVLLVLATLAAGRDVAVSRGESVEIGGAFRVPEVLEQSGARLVDVGTTNRTRLADYQRAIVRPGNDIAVVLKVHPSNYRIDGFVESTSVSELAGLGIPIVADIGSGLIDADVPWLGGPPPAWLAGEPAALQTLEAGADLVTFSGDKLLGGPAGRHHRRSPRTRRGVRRTSARPRAALRRARARRAAAGRARLPGAHGRQRDPLLADGRAAGRRAARAGREDRRRLGGRRGDRDRVGSWCRFGARVSRSRRAASCSTATTSPRSGRRRRRSWPASAKAGHTSTCAASIRATTRSSSRH